MVFDTVRRASIPRSLYYSRRLRGRVVVDRHAFVSIARDAVVELSGGSTLVIGIEPARRTTTFEVLPRAQVFVDGTVSLMGGSYVRVSHDATLSIGDRSYINSGTRLVCGHQLTVGAGCAISWNVSITDTDVHTIHCSRGTSTTNGTVTIGDRVWVGANSTVLKGVDIGSGSVIAAGSVVNRSVPDATLVAWQSRTSGRIGG